MKRRFNPLTGLKRCNVYRAWKGTVVYWPVFQSPDGAKEVQHGYEVRIRVMKDGTFQSPDGAKEVQPARPP